MIETQNRPKRKHIIKITTQRKKSVPQRTSSIRPTRPWFSDNQATSARGVKTQSLTSRNYNLNRGPERLNRTTWTGGHHDPRLCGHGDLPCQSELILGGPPCLLSVHVLCVVYASRASFSGMLRGYLSCLWPEPPSPDCGAQACARQFESSCQAAINRTECQLPRLGITQPWPTGLSTIQIIPQARRVQEFKLY